MSVYIISDLHIYSAEDPIYRALLSLIEEKPKQGDDLILAGDIFDLFIGGKKIFKERYQLFFDELEKAIHRGVEVHYIEGNHDFLLKDAFYSFQKVKIHEESVTLNRSGKRFLVAHGDLANHQDYRYRITRWFFRSLFCKFLFMVIPGHWIDCIGKFLSQKSRDHHPVLFTDLPVDEQNSIRKIYRNFAAEKIVEGFDFVVMGHCHDLDEKNFQVAGRSGQYINVGFPRVHGTYLVWSSEFVPVSSKIHREPIPGYLFSHRR